VVRPPCLHRSRPSPPLLRMCSTKLQTYWRTRTTRGYLISGSRMWWTTQARLKEAFHLERISASAKVPPMARTPTPPLPQHSSTICSQTKGTRRTLSRQCFRPMAAVEQDQTLPATLSTSFLRANTSAKKFKKGCPMTWISNQETWRIKESTARLGAAPT